MGAWTHFPTFGSQFFGHRKSRLKGALTLLTQSQCVFIDVVESAFRFFWKNGWAIIQTAIVLSTIGYVLLRGQCLYSLRLGESSPSSCEVVHGP